jgi:hypothetical protein
MLQWVKLMGVKCYMENCFKSLVKLIETRAILFLIFPLQIPLRLQIK